MKKIAWKYGLWMLAGFILYFLAMHLLGLSDRYNLRVFNGLIHLGLLYLAIQEYRAMAPETAGNYVSGVAVGIYTSAVGVAGFCAFMLLYLALSPEFMSDLKQHFSFEKYLNPVTATIFILVEGTAISLIGAYILTRFIDMRRSRS